MVKISIPFQSTVNDLAPVLSMQYFTRLHTASRAIPGLERILELYSYQMR
jgi:hypothetical protein